MSLSTAKIDPRGGASDLPERAVEREPIIEFHGGLRCLRWPAEEPQRGCLVLVHGMGDGADIWRATVAALQDMRCAEVLAVELPGHWGSVRKADGYYAFPDLAASLKAIITREAAGQPIWLVGHSLGARLLAYLAGTDQVRSDALVLVDMGIEPSERGMEAVHDHIDALNHPPFSGAVLAEIAIARLPFCTPEAVRLYLDAAVEALPDGVSHSVDPAVLDIDMLVDGEELDFGKVMAQIACPVAILRGAYSSILPGHVAHGAAMRLQSCAGYFTVAKAGHAIPLEQPATLARLIERSCAQPDTGSAAAW